MVLPATRLTTKVSRSTCGAAAIAALALLVGLLVWSAGDDTASEGPAAIGDGSDPATPSPRAATREHVLEVLVNEHLPSPQTFFRVTIYYNKCLY